MNLLLLVACATLALPVSAQPTSGPHAPDPSSEMTTPASAALDASLDAVAHHGEAVLLWDALSGADAYVVQAGAPGAPLVEVARLSADAATDAVGYSVRLDLPDGQYQVRLVATGIDAESSRRDVTVEAPDAFDREDEALASLLASN